MLDEVLFGCWRKKPRNLLGFTREEFAQKAGCFASALRKIETAERHPSKQLAELPVNILEVFTETGERANQL